MDSELSGSSISITLHIYGGKRLLAFLREKPFRQCRAEGKVYMTSNYSPQSYLSQQGYQNPAYMHQAYLQQIQQQMQLQSMRQQMALAELQRQRKIDEENRKERLTRLADAIRAKDQSSRSKRAEAVARDKSAKDEAKLVSIE